MLGQRDKQNATNTKAKGCEPLELYTKDVHFVGLDLDNPQPRPRSPVHASRRRAASNCNAGKARIDLKPRECDG
jgi:hypothetical protein